MLRDRQNLDSYYIQNSGWIDTIEIDRIWIHIQNGGEINRIWIHIQNSNTKPSHQTKR